MGDITRVCVVGAGAIGSLLVGHIGALPDIAMTVLVRRESHARDLNEKGVWLNSRATFPAPWS